MNGGAMKRGDELRRALFIVTPSSRRLGDPALDSAGDLVLALSHSLFTPTDRQACHYTGPAALNNSHPGLHADE
jgi:hypothetical protein